MKLRTIFLVKKALNAKRRVFGKVITGLIAGFLNGLFGGGGGMAVVPCLNFICGYPAKKSHATAILIMLPLSVLSGVIYFAYGKFDLSLTATVTLGVTVGGIVGSFFLKKLKNKVISVIFSFVMAAAGVKTLFF